MKKAKPVIKTTRIVFNRSLNEYTVKLFLNGNHYKPGDYFTDDKQDATDTAACMLKEC